MLTPKPHLSSANLIAPCGINCRLCRAYGRQRNPRAGCRSGDAFKSRSCIQCSVHCEKLAAGALKYCFECDEFPCKRLTHLDKRYRTRYATSPIDNLNLIRAHGIRAFIRDQDEKWKCPACGAMLCMHDPECPSCGHRWHT